MAVASPRRPSALRPALIVLGWLLIIVSPVTALIPGPGGVFVFAAGAALVLKNSRKAKRWFVRAEKRWPGFERWAALALRRRSPRHHAEAAGLKARVRLRWRSRRTDLAGWMGRLVGRGG